MKRMTVAALAIALASCANFDQLEDDALDAGRVAGLGGGSAGGMGGGSAGGTSGGSAGGSSGGMSGGSAGGMSGGSAGGMSGGSAGGTSGGSAGGMSGGSAGGTSGGGSAGLREPWLGTPFRTRSTPTYAIAASAVNELFVEAYGELDGGTSVVANGLLHLVQPATTIAMPTDLDARFGMATVVLNDALSVFVDGQWVPAPPGGVLGTLLTAPLYRRLPATLVSLYTFSPTSSSSVWVTTYSIEDGGLSSGGSPLQLASLMQPSRLRVRPDSNGTYGSIVSDTFYARIENANPMSTDSSNDRLLVASSESQFSMVVGNQSGAIPGALFWFPSGRTTLPSPDVRVDAQTAGDGGLFARAVATNGGRHAAILGPAHGNDVWTTLDAGVALNAGEWVLFLFGAGPPRFVVLGTVPRAPFDLAFGALGGTHGLFVMANCTAPAADGGICSGAGSVIGFLAQP